MLLKKWSGELLSKTPEPNQTNGRTAKLWKSLLLRKKCRIPVCCSVSAFLNSPLTNGTTVTPRKLSGNHEHHCPWQDLFIHMCIYPREEEWPSDLIIPVRRQPWPALNMFQTPRVLSELDGTSPMPRVETDLEENNLHNSVVGKVLNWRGLTIKLSCPV